MQLTNDARCVCGAASHVVTVLQHPARLLQLLAASGEQSLRVGRRDGGITRTSSLVFNTYSVDAPLTACIFIILIENFPQMCAA